MFSFYYGCNNCYLDVTEKVNNYVNNGIVHFNHSYNAVFGDPLPGNFKHLLIESPMMQSLKVKEDFPFILSLEPQREKINVVYFINTFCSNQYSFLLREHLQGMVNNGLAEEADIYVEASGEDPKIIDEVKKIIPSAHVTLHPNSHEYPGIKRVWDLGQKEENSFILYFHSKGITRLNNKLARDPLEILLYHDLVENWEDCVNFLSYFPSLDKIGRFISGPGWSWHNFFWVRSSYLKDFEEPLKTERRHYYEDWLARKKNVKWTKTEREIPLTHENYKIDGKNFLSTCSLPKDLHPGHQMKRNNPHGEICNLGESYTT